MEMTHLHRNITKSFGNASLTIYSDSLNHEALLAQLFDQLLVVIRRFRFDMLTCHNLIVQNVLKYERSEPI